MAKANKNNSIQLTEINPLLLRSIFILFLAFSLSSLLPAQDINQIIAAQQIDTLLNNGPKDNRINWAIQNRGTDNPNDQFPNRAAFIQAFEDDLLLTFIPGHDQAQVPYAQYNKFFNIYAFWWEDALSESEGWNFNILHAIRDSLFLPWQEENYGWITFFSTTRYGGGGGAGLERDRRVGSGKLYGMEYETFLHEFGHTMPGLLDEYSASGEWSGGQCWETPNTTGALEYDEIPWRKWIDPETPFPTPYTGEYLDKMGAFEGAMTNYFGCHRPTARGCFMGAGGFGEDYGTGLCSPCIQRVICYLYQYVNVIENPFPAAENLSVTGPESLHFSADILKPEPNTQQYEWILNGKVIATGVEEVDITFGSCDTYELILAVTDTNSLVRYDEKFAHIYPKPYQERRWTIEQTEVTSYDFAADETVINADCTGGETGSVSFSISGGVGPYQLLLENQELQSPVSNLSEGAYAFAIVDANGCGFTKEISIGQEAILDPKICTALNGNLWSLSVEDANYTNDELTFLWSNGATTPGIANMPDGDYTISVTTNAGCTVEQAISLTYIDPSLQVNATTFPSSPEKSTGKIYLEITNGRPPYSIEWRDKLNRDLTTTNTDHIDASGMDFGHLPEYAFDDNLNTKWLHNISSNAFIEYRIPGGSVINLYTITSADDVPERDPRKWQLLGSFDGQNWVPLDEQSNFDFGSRFERRSFLFSNNTPYEYYRLLILENHGNSAIQLQEIEFIGADAADEFVINEEAKDQQRRFKLAPGIYQYTVKDANQTAVAGTINIDYAPSFFAENLHVIQADDCKVKIETPNAAYVYYWLGDADASEILATGEYFQPPATGSYYVAALNVATNAISSNIRNFAVTLPAAPEVELVDETTFTILAPDPALTYQWFSEDECGIPVHTGTSFQPLTNGDYFVAATSNTIYPDPINPIDIPGMLVRMDASDINGDGLIDDPAPATGSTYGWTFSNGNGWSEGSWYAYRSNYQNGLGIADFATIWLQRINHEETGYQTMIMAYQENRLSFPGTAPFESLASNFPIHEDGSQLYSNNAPARTLNGATYLNGNIVDPLNTPNDFKFNVLGTVMTQVSNYPVFYTDTRWEGKIGEILLYQNALTDAQMKGLSSYLRKKWISVADLQSPRTAISLGNNTATEEQEKPSIQLFPNPTSGIFEIRGLTGANTITILNAAGKVLRTQHTTDAVLSVNIYSLPAGVYFVSIEHDDGSFRRVEKVLKR